MTGKDSKKVSESMRKVTVGVGEEGRAVTTSVFNHMRNKEIVRLVDEQHVTMTAIAKWFGISKQRVQQVYKKEKPKDV